MNTFQLPMPALEVLHRSEGKIRGAELSRLQLADFKSGKLRYPTAVVASSKEDVRWKIAEIVTHSGLATFVAPTIGKPRKIVEQQRQCLAVCDDRLTDGSYEDLLSDWPEYLKAVSADAFDYVAYPPNTEDFRRVIRHAMRTHFSGHSDFAHSDSTKYTGAEI